jgi:predicted tellurium resistance membrane protein TerC
MTSFLPSILAAAGVADSASLWSVESLIAFLTLAALEIVLGIDNVIFIAILAAKLPAGQQDKARKIGIAAAVITRVLLLLSLSWLMGLTKPLFAIWGHDFSGKDLILFVGGAFLIAKATIEIHDKLEGEEHGPSAAKAAANMAGVVGQIMLLDIVFSLDSVITAVGMANHVPVMIAAIIVAAAVMLLASGSVSRFVERHPTMKILALSFLILIGVALVADSFGRHVEKGYLYFAMAFSFGVELLNLRIRARAKPVELRHSKLPPVGKKA